MNRLMRWPFLTVILAVGVYTCLYAQGQAGVPRAVAERMALAAPVGPARSASGAPAADGNAADQQFAIEAQNTRTSPAGGVRAETGNPSVITTFFNAGLNAQSNLGPAIYATSNNGTGAMISSGGAPILPVNLDALQVMSLSSTGRAGIFTVSNTASTANALEATSNANGTGRTAFFNATGTGFSNGINAVQLNYADNTNLTVFPGLTPHTANGVYVKSGNGADFTFGGGSTWGSFSAAVKGDSDAKVGVSGSSTTNFGVMGFTKSGTALYGLASSPGSNALVAYYGGATASTSFANNIAVFQTGSGSVARIDGTGKGFFNGGTQTGGADVAEAFNVEGNRGRYEPGDVLVISTSSDRTLEKSTTPYSTAVVGVYATKPGVLLTPRNVEANHDDMIPLGALGVMPTKVTAENGPIHRGDLLVTAKTAGHAMRAKAHPAVGTVIGKALGNFEGPGAGVIEVFVNVK